MPLYEYQCPKCGRFEVIQKFSDAPLAACPTCGAEVQKMLSAPAIQFKGTGWYITDYARKGGGKGESKTEGGGEAAKKDAGASSTKESGSTPSTSGSGSSGSGSSGSSGGGSTGSSSS